MILICCGGCGKVGLNESFVFLAWFAFSFAGAKHHQKKSQITFLAIFGSPFMSESEPGGDEQRQKHSFALCLS